MKCYQYIEKLITAKRKTSKMIYNILLNCKENLIFVKTSGLYARKYFKNDITPNIAYNLSKSYKNWILKEEDNILVVEGSGNFSFIEIKIQKPKI